jgi:hypothetical protein
MTGPAQQRGFTPKGYKTLSCSQLAPHIFVSSPLLCCRSVDDLRQLVVLALPCEIMLLTTHLDMILLLFFSFFS